MNKALLDTDIDSEAIKAIDPSVTRNAIAYRKDQGILPSSTTTVMEVVRGFQRTRSRRKLQSFLVAVAFEDVLAFDQHAAELPGRIADDLGRGAAHRRRRSNGSPPSPSITAWIRSRAPRPTPGRSSSSATRSR